MKIHVIICVYILCGIQFSAQSQSVVYVNEAALGNNDGTSWSDAYTNLQTAIDAAQVNDTLWVAMGSYFGNFTLPDATDMVLLGGFDATEFSAHQRDWIANETILDANNSGRVLYTSNLTSSSLLDGFTIQNGAAAGGGVFSQHSNMQLKNLKIKNNSGTNGAGLYFSDTSFVTLENISIEDCEAVNYGGGLYVRKNCEVTMNAVNITNCSAIYGGGISNNLNSKLWLSNCSIDSNSCDYFGGAVYTYNGAYTAIDSCSFTGNDGFYGGALYDQSIDSIAISNSIFKANSVSGEGGAILHCINVVSTCENLIFVENTADRGGAISVQDDAQLNLINCLFDSNDALEKGGALYTEGTNAMVVKSINCTYTGNVSEDGGAIFWEDKGADTLINSIFYGNSATTSSDIDKTTFSGSTFIDYSLTQEDASTWLGGTTWGTNNLTPGTDPLFVNETNGIGNDAEWLSGDDGFVLSSTSPCANVGDAGRAPITDISGVMRPTAPTMGAYETYCYYDDIAPIPLTANLPLVEALCQVDSIPEPMATDDCSVITTSDAVFPITSTTVVTWTYTDFNGNVSTQQQSVQINQVDVAVNQVDDLTLEATNTNATSYQWIDCSTQNAISGATSAQFTANSNGQYAVVVTEVNCSDTSACFTIDQVGLDAMSNEHLLLAPNPSNGGTVKILGEGELSNLLVMDATGKRIPVEIDWNQRSFNTEHLSAGTYFVQLDSAQSSATQILIITSN